MNNENILQYQSIVTTKRREIIDNYIETNNLSKRLRSSLTYFYDEFLHLIHRTGETLYKTTQKTIAKYVGFSRTHTNKLIRHLECAGLIVIIEDTTAKNPYENYFWYRLPLQVELYNSKQESIEKAKNNAEDIKKKAIEKAVKQTINNSKNSYNNYGKYNKVDSFNDFEQRDYDYNDLEMKLLGLNTPQLE